MNRKKKKTGRDLRNSYKQVLIHKNKIRSLALSHTRQGYQHVITREREKEKKNIAIIVNFIKVALSERRPALTTQHIEGSDKTTQ